MKRVLSIILTLFIFAGFAFAQEEGDEYDDGYVYETNGAGDQFLKFGIGPFVPIGFGGSVKNGDGSLYIGGNINVGYYRFISKNFAIGGEASASYNVSVGNKQLIMIPITFGVMYQPTIGNFEFPILLTAGFGYETWQNMNYFPSLALNSSAGVFYRISEAFSAGISGNYYFIPQWSKGKVFSKGEFVGINISGRYHF